MISVSSVKLQMYCPMKLYIKNHVDTEENNDYQLAMEIKKLKIDIQDILEKNMRRIKKEMSVDEIEKILSETIDFHIERSAESLLSMDYDITLDEINEIKNESLFKTKLLALQLKKAMVELDRNAFELTSMFFPNRIYHYLLKDEQLGLMGNCDKVEIIEGNHYPVLVKNSNPPLAGVWDSDAIELAAYGILLEDEFQSDVYVGFVDYEKVSQRRPVVLDVNIRKALFSVMQEVRDIIDNKKKPNVKKGHLKCERCEYNNICE